MQMNQTIMESKPPVIQDTHSIIDEYKQKEMELPLVSICTPTFNRRPFIVNMIQVVRNQSYPLNRIEWIIVDDGTDKIEDLIQAANMPQIKYYKIAKKMRLGAKRNLMHSYTSGSILVYMDDDDWYPRERIEHSVAMLLRNPQYLCAGSSELYLYHTEAKQMYQLGPYGPNHATAGTFAFRRELLNMTRYNDDAALAEEKDFLKNHTIPMLQMDPLKTILVFTHDQNTFDKRNLLNENNPTAKKSNKSLKLFFPHEKEKQFMKFYSEKVHKELKLYEAGKPENKPDVIEQTKEIMAKRQFEIPMVPLCINGQTQTLSINDMVQIMNQMRNDNTQLTMELQRVNKEYTEYKEKHSLSSKQTSSITSPPPPVSSSLTHEIDNYTTLPLVETVCMGITRKLTTGQASRLINSQFAHIGQLSSRINELESERMILNL